MTTAADLRPAALLRMDGRQMTKATAFLRTCLREDDRAGSPPAASLLDGVVPERFVAFARFHGVLGLIGPGIERQTDIPAWLHEAVRHDRELAIHRHLQAIWQLSRLAPILDASGVAWSVVKGPVAVELLYGERPGRPYHDLDVLVDPAGFGTVLAALENGGFAPLDRNWAVLRRDMRGEVHYRGREGVEIDLHWNLVNMYRGRMRVGTRELLRRAEMVKLAGLPVPALDPTDSLAHLCLHAAISGGDRMIWVKDIERAIAARPPDWEELIRRTRRWHVAAPVGLLMLRARQFLGAAVPQAVLSDLLGRAERTMIRGLDRVFPWPQAQGRLANPNRLMARSVGQGLVGATAWLVVRSFRNLDPGQEQAASAFTPGGDERDRAAFVEAVTRVSD